jgi:hypothetical protein
MCEHLFDAVRGLDKAEDEIEFPSALGARFHCTNYRARVLNREIE